MKTNKANLRILKAHLKNDKLNGDYFVKIIEDIKYDLNELEKKEIRLNTKVSSNTKIETDEIMVIDISTNKVLLDVFQCFEYGDEPLTLKEIVDKALENKDDDKKQNSCLLILCENHLNGIIYRYNNCGEQEFYVAGVLGGFA